MLVAQWLFSPQLGMIAGIAAVVGNNWPVFYGFKGGRGVAAAAGAVTALVPLALGLSLAPALVAFVLTRNVGIASLALFGIATTLTWALAYPVNSLAYAGMLPFSVALYTLGSRRRVPLLDRWRTTFLRHSG